MFPDTEEKYQKLLTEIVQKLIVILGPTITLAKARRVKGLIVTDDGTVTGVAGTDEDTAQKLIKEFSTLSDTLVTQTMQPLLAYQSKLTDVTPQATIPPPQPQTPEPTIPPSAPSVPEHSHPNPAPSEPPSTSPTEHTSPLVAPLHADATPIPAPIEQNTIAKQKLDN